MTLSVRPAEPTDLEWLISQLKHFSKFFGTKLPLFSDESYANNFMMRMIDQHYVRLAVTETGERAGFIAGFITPHMYNPDITVLAETFWWVDEAYRGSRAGLLLLNEFTAWGEQNVDWVIFGLEEHSPVNERVLLKRGYRLRERNFIKETA